MMLSYIRANNCYVAVLLYDILDSQNGFIYFVVAVVFAFYFLLIVIFITNQNRTVKSMLTRDVVGSE